MMSSCVTVQRLEPSVLRQAVSDLHDVVLRHCPRGAGPELVEEVRLLQQELLEVLLAAEDEVLLVHLVYLLPLQLGQPLPALPAHEEDPHLLQLLAGRHVAGLLQQLLEVLPEFVSILLRVELVEQIFVDSFSLSGVQDVERYSVLCGVAVKQVCLHPSGILWVLHKPTVEILMLPDSLLYYYPVLLAKTGDV